MIAPVVLVNESAGVAKNFCALELATTSALQVIFARSALRGMDSEDSGPGRHEKRAQKKTEPKCSSDGTMMQIFTRLL